MHQGSALAFLKAFTPITSNPFTFPLLLAERPRRHVLARTGKWLRLARFLDTWLTVYNVSR